MYAALTVPRGFVALLAALLVFQQSACNAARPLSHVRGQDSQQQHRHHQTALVSADGDDWVLPAYRKLLKEAAALNTWDEEEKEVAEEEGDDYVDKLLDEDADLWSHEDIVRMYKTENDDLGTDTKGDEAETLPQKVAQASHRKLLQAGSQQLDSQGPASSVTVLPATDNGVPFRNVAEVDVGPNDSHPNNEPIHRINLTEKDSSQLADATPLLKFAPGGQEARAIIELVDATLYHAP